MLEDKFGEFIIYNDARVEQDGSTYLLVKAPKTLVKKLAVIGDQGGFNGERHGDTLLCSLSSENANVLCQRLPWLRPMPLGLQTSFGYGDRLGSATPVHIIAIREAAAAPVFAQHWRT
jgi:tagaturonate epimerase